jgi:FkbM family methyltransferase
MELIKRVAARVPKQWQYEMKRIHYRRQVRRGKFGAGEPEYDILSSMISAGEWVIDVGANVGNYTMRFAELVGVTGRVIAFEPIPETFSLLAANVQLLRTANVTLVNAAVSEKTSVVSMSIPYFKSGLRNFYQAHLSSSPENGVQVLAMSLDSLNIANRIALVKIDVEGHEAGVLAGMNEILLRDRPTLIVETDSREIINDLETIGYMAERLEGSPNVLFRVGEG